MERARDQLADRHVDAGCVRARHRDERDGLSVAGVAARSRSETGREMAASTSGRLDRQRHAGPRSGRWVLSFRVGGNPMNHDRFAEVVRLLGEARDAAHDTECREMWDQKLRQVQRTELSEANLRQQER